MLGGARMMVLKTGPLIYSNIEISHSALARVQGSLIDL